jgi:hypothetical protein
MYGHLHEIEHISIHSYGKSILHVQIVRTLCWLEWNLIMHIPLCRYVQMCTFSCWLERGQQSAVILITTKRPFAPNCWSSVVVTWGWKYSCSSGPSDSRHASTRAGTLEPSCNGIILNDFGIKNADAGAESTSNSSKLGRQTGNAPTSFPKIICL